MRPLEYFEARWTERLPALRLVNPSNAHVDVNELPDPWAGVLVQAADFRNLTMGSQSWQQETGLFVVGLFTRAGDGFAANDTVVRNVRAAFMNWQSSDGVLRVEQIDGPLDIDPQADEGWHQLALEMHYQAWTREPPP